MNYFHVPVFESAPHLLRNALIPSFSRGRLMKRKEDLFSRQQFICVCVFVPPSSVLQISQLCEELKGADSTLSAPISSLRFVHSASHTPIHTHTYTQELTHTHTNLSHFVLFTWSFSLSLILIPSPPVFPSLSPETRSLFPTLLSLFKL